MTPANPSQLFIQTLRDMLEADRAVRWARQMHANIADAAQYRQFFPAGRFERPAFPEGTLTRALPEHGRPAE